MQSKLFARLILCIMAMVICQMAKGDDAKVYPDHVYDDNIKSVVLYNSDAVLSDPIIGAGKGGNLHLGFDDLSPDIRNFYYTFVHCENDWQESDLHVFDYLSGVTEDKITDYKLSFNTLQHYTHFNLDFPTSALRPTKSGNYALLVYEEDKKEFPVFIKHFMIVSSKVDVNATWDKSLEYQYSETHQAIKFTINTKQLPISNPFEEIEVVIKQNGRTDNAISNLKPLFVNGTTLDYNLSTGNIFAAGRDFRRFDIRSIRVKREHVRQITNENNMNNVDLSLDDIRTYTRFFNDIDINGKFILDDYESTTSPEIEGEYCMVHFFLPTSTAFMGGSLYIFGALTNWEITPQSKMEYNPKNGAYEGQLYLKQGYYNYQYVFVGKDGVLSNTETEGNYYDAENNYQIFVYYHPIGARFEQLVGYTLINTGTNK